MRSVRWTNWGLMVALLPLAGCQNLSRFSYAQKADGSAALQAAGQSKDGAAKFNVNTTTAAKGAKETLNVKYDAPPPPPVTTFVR